MSNENGRLKSKRFVVTGIDSDKDGMNTGTFQSHVISTSFSGAMEKVMLERYKADRTNVKVFKGDRSGYSSNN